MLVRDEIIPMLTVKDVAVILNIHVNTVRRWSDQGILKSFRITSRGDRRFRQQDIARFLADYNDFNTNKSRARHDNHEPMNAMDILPGAGDILR
jgi:excisionase family DNA binding protein